MAHRCTWRCYPGYCAGPPRLSAAAKAVTGHDPDAALPGGTVSVSRYDLDCLLAHFYDEVTGSPARSHWRLPLLRAACDRLAAATRPPGAQVHPAVIRDPEGDPR